VLGWVTSKLGLTRFTTAQTWGKPPPSSLLYTLCLSTSPRDPHPNGFLSWDSQVRVPKLPKLRLPRLWKPITLCVNLRLWWGLKKHYSPCRAFFNGMCHVTYTHINYVDSRLLVVGSQIANLTSDLFFSHNLCFKCPNGWYEPILDIFVSIAFQWYKEIFEPLGFDPCNHSLNIRESTGTPTPNMRALGSVRVFSLTFFCTLGAWECDS